MLRLGYKASAEQFGPRELLDFAALAEQVGFDSVFISDHFQPWKHTGGHAPFSLAWLGALGARTSRIVMGTSVMTPTFRYHPVDRRAGLRHARASCVPDRVVLGVGTGESLNEVPATGHEWPEFKERFARLREAVALMRQLWTRGARHLRGPVLPDRERDHLRPPGDAGADLCRGARARWSRKYAGPCRRRLHLHQRQGARALHRDAAAEGRRRGWRRPDATRTSYARMIEMKVSFDTDAQRALEDTTHWAALALVRRRRRCRVEDPREMERLADALPVERAASRWIVSTDPDEQVERIRPYVELGFRHLVFHAPGPDQERFLRLYAEQRAARDCGRRSPDDGMSRIASLELLALPGVPIVRPGDDLAGADRRRAGPRGSRRKRTTCSWSRRRSSRRPKDASSIWRTVEPSPEAVALGCGDRQGRAARRGDPVGIGARRAHAAPTC